MPLARQDIVKRAAQDVVLLQDMDIPAGHAGIIDQVLSSSQRGDTTADEVHFC